MNEIKLPVPYYSQRDNVSEPERSCNKSACCMAAEYIKPGIFGGSDNVYSILLEGYGDTTNHEAHTRLLSARGFKTEFRYDLSYEDLDESLFNRKMPVVIGVLHRGHYLTPYGGHMIIVVGKRETGEYICHDPWGNPFSYDGDNGKDCIIPKQSLDTRWLADGDKSGWGRLFYPS
jgi:hypothetical protein